MPLQSYVPHVDLLAKAMRIPRERLTSRARIAIEAPLLRLILARLVATLPFSEPFYRNAYPDLAAAAASGQITDLHHHFIETGYFEGRLGAPPDLDDAFYLAAYPEVAHAIAHGDTASPLDHYLRAGAAEGRVPSAAQAPEIEAWMRLLQVQMRPEA